jgi:TolB-like protein/tetratricopeptide (TPR) repeat protein
MGAAATIAVLPFDNPSGDPEQGYLARGFVEELVTELSRFPTIEVIHHHGSGALGSASPTGNVAVSYLLRGSVRRLGEQIRIGAQLVQAADGRQIWADRFDAPADRVLAVQDEIVARVASALPTQIDAALLRGAWRKPLSSLDVYDCWLRGLDHLRRGTLEDDERARTFFERALSLDPHSARAHAGLSLSHFNEWSCQRWEKWEEKEELAFEHARRAAELDDRDGLIQIILGRVLLYRRRHDEGARYVHRALELCPNDAEVLANAARCVSYLGDQQSAASLAEKAMRLNPWYPEWYLSCVAVPLFHLGRDVESVALLSKAPTSAVDTPAYLAAAHALLGDRAQARTYLDLFLSEIVEKITFGRVPEAGEPLRWVIQVNPFRRKEDIERLARGLELAGLAADPDEQRPVTRRRAAASTFRREEGRWTLAFEGSAVQLSETKGLQDLATLLAQPQQEIHCLELAGRTTEPTGDAPMLDERARREIGRRVRELQETIDEAEADHDPGRAESAREELERIVDLLSGSLGLGGKSRRLGSAAERARSAVTWRIRNAIRKIASVHPPLGRHLDNSIRTGIYCTYVPEKTVDWAF